MPQYNVHVTTTHNESFHVEASSQEEAVASVRAWEVVPTTVIVTKIAKTTNLNYTVSEVLEKASGLTGFGEVDEEDFDDDELPYCEECGCHHAFIGEDEE